MLKVQQIIPVEALCWLCGLVLLACLNPSKEAGFSLCLFHHLGWSCPGCGLGHSIALLFRGDVQGSIQTHVLGIPTLFILIHKIIVLSINHFKYGKSYRYTS